MAPSLIEGIFALLYDLSDWIICINKSGSLIWANKLAEQHLPIAELFKLPSLHVYLKSKKNANVPKKPEKWGGLIVQIESQKKYFLLRQLGDSELLLKLLPEHFFFTLSPEISGIIKEEIKQYADPDQQVKLAVIGELASGVMHDIRNPLSAISSFNNYMLKQAIRTCDLKRMDKCQKGIEKAVARIQRLSNHLRDFSRGEKEEPSEFLIKDFIDDSLLITKSRIGESGAKVIVNYGSNSLSIFGCPHKLEQVLINLISNACDAVKSRRAARIDIDVEEESSTISIVITDNGSGIKQEHIETIFESFFTTKPKGQGTGLGLSICANIVREQGGQLEVASTYGEGATFRLTFLVILKRSRASSIELRVC